MWSISVEPMPSRIGRPQVLSNRRNTSGGSGSAADRQIRTDEKSRVFAPSALTRALYNVGTEKKAVGRCVSTVEKIGSGLGLPGVRTVVAPTQEGEKMPLPIP